MESADVDSMNQDNNRDCDDNNNVNSDNDSIQQEQDETVIVISSDDEVDDGVMVVSNSRTVVQTFVLTCRRTMRYVNDHVVDSGLTFEKEFYQHEYHKYKLIGVARRI